MGVLRELELDGQCHVFAWGGDGRSGLTAEEWFLGMHYLGYGNKQLDSGYAGR